MFLKTIANVFVPQLSNIECPQENSDQAMSHSLTLRKIKLYKSCTNYDTSVPWCRRLMVKGSKSIFHIRFHFKINLIPCLKAQYYFRQRTIHRKHFTVRLGETHLVTLSTFTLSGLINAVWIGVKISAPRPNPPTIKPTTKPRRAGNHYQNKDIRQNCSSKKQSAESYLH